MWPSVKSARVSFFVFQSIVFSIHGKLPFCISGFWANDKTLFSFPARTAVCKVTVSYTRLVRKVPFGTVDCRVRAI